MWRLKKFDAGKVGQGSTNALPDPERDIFRGGISQIFDIVEAAVIELFDYGTTDCFKIKKVDDKSAVRIDRTFKDDFDAIGMAMHALAAMRVGNIRKSVCGFKGEGLANNHRKFAILCI